MFLDKIKDSPAFEIFNLASRKQAMGEKVVSLAIGFTGLGAAAVACYGFAALITIGPSRFRLRRDALADIPAPTG